MKLTHLRLPEVRKWLHWQLARAWGALGTLELVALAVLGLWLGLYLQVNRPLHAETVLLDTRIQELRAQHDAEMQTGNTHKTVVDISKNFVAFLPDERQRELQLAKLHKLADQHNLLLSRADYRIEPVAVLALQRVSLRLSIQGGYGLQRQFMHALLAALPNLALERITLEKAPGLSDSMNTLVDASLYYRPAAERSTRL